MYDRKPNCSYNCLIGMALKSSENGRLPVGEIYRFFEREFPYFLTAAEPWKNSLRHSLSLGHYFRKYNSDKLVTKKGHLWEVDPQRAAELDKEMYMFLAKGLPENTPTSPQLSKLRLQMTQLLLDSIKNTPQLPCHSATPPGAITCTATPMRPHPAMLNSMPFSYTPPRPGSAEAFRRPDIIMLPHPGASFNNGLPRQMYPPPGTPVHSHMTPPSLQGRSVTVGGLLTSTPKAKRSLQTPQTPKGVPRKRQVASDLRESFDESMEHKKDKLAALRSPRPPTNGNGSMCDEAYQLVQFCNHCTLGLDSSNTSVDMQSPDVSCHSTLNGYSTPNQLGTPMKPRATPLPTGPGMNDIQTLFSPEQEDRHYPFMVPPTSERDAVLSQLNDAGYQWHPGPPKELVITKCKPQDSTSELCRTCTEMEEAIRPVVYNWNSWWEAENIVCMMNEELYTNYVECRSEEDMQRILGKSTRRIRKVLKTSASGKTPDASYVTPTKNPVPVSGPVSEPVRRGSHGRLKRGCGQNWMKKYKAQRTLTIGSSCGKPSLKEPGDPCGKSLVVDACKSLKLIVSIPFRKLITERQLKKYCGEGGKHRIPTQ